MRLARQARQRVDRGAQAGTRTHSNEMTTLILQLPARERPGYTTHACAELTYATSADGQEVGVTGQAVVGALPKADEVVAVVPPTELSWHLISVPRAPAARLRTALGGVLEEHLLDDDDQVHLALAPDARPGAAGWVAATNGPWLGECIAALEQAGHRVNRVVPAVWPSDTPLGHFFQGPGDDGPASATWLALGDEGGVACLRLDSALARARQAAWVTRATKWTALPASAAAAERWLGAAVQVCPEAEALLRASRSTWNLRQFAWAPSTRGTQWLRDAWVQLRTPQWRPLRWGLAALLGVQVLGVNLYAWQQRQHMQRQQAAIVDVLRSTHPQVRAVLDAPVQMQRETELLRAAAGRTGSSDLEPLLGAAARAWPDGLAPAQNLRYEPGRLQVSAAGWTPQQVAQFGDRIRQSGGSAEAADGQVVVTLGRATAGGAQ
jgi:general secretion pathway protein L